MPRCRCCYPGDPLVQCEKMEGHEMMPGQPRFHKAAPRKESIMWKGEKEIVWEKSWTPRPFDPAFLAYWARWAKQHRGFTVESIAADLGWTVEEAEAAAARLVDGRAA